MKIKSNTIITLDNEEQYVVLNEVMYQGNKYFLVMGLDEKKEVVSSNVAIFKEVVEGLDTYVELVLEPNLMSSLTKLLKEQN